MSHGRYPPGRKQSPLKMTARLFPTDFLEPGDRTFSTEWKIIRPIRAAQFRSILTPRVYAILHPSTKEPKRWQLSTFDERGAVGDLIMDTPDSALEWGLSDGFDWRLESVVAADGTRYGRKR